LRLIARHCSYNGQAQSQGVPTGKSGILAD
jgi:hypothetical protein